METKVESTQDIFHDPRVRGIAWRDLVPVSRVEVVRELLLPALWLSLSLVAAYVGWYAVALPLSFIFFLTGLRIVHNAFHGALGLPRPMDGLVLWVMSLIMLGSMHAVRFNHLRHHSHMLTDDDVEGRSAAMPAGRALLFGPAFTVLLHITALRYGKRQLVTTVFGELLMNGLPGYSDFPEAAY